jgi:hypothetical protein
MINSYITGLPVNIMRYSNLINIYFIISSGSFSEFPIGNTAITVGLMERLKPRGLAALAVMSSL